MKRFLYVLVIVICSVATTAYGQSISGKLTTEGWSKSIQISSHEPVSLLKILEMESIKYFSILKAQPAKKP